MEIHQDILSIIFEHYTFDIDGHIGPLILVSKHWMHVASNMSRLWARINVTADERWCSPLSSGVTICRTSNSVDAVFSRSKKQPLEVVMAIGIEGSISTCSPEKRASLFQFVFNKYGSRISRLTIDVMLHSSKQIREVEASLTHVFMFPLPLLKSLEIAPRGVPAAVYGELFDIAILSSTTLCDLIVCKDSLQELVTRGFHTGSIDQHFLDLQVHSSGYPGMPFSLLSTISTKLRDLTVFESLSSPTHTDGNHSPELLQFPRLRTLCVGFISMKTLSHLILPILTDLSVFRSIIDAPMNLPRGSIVLPSLKTLHVQSITPSITHLRAPFLIELSIETAISDMEQTTRDFEEIFTNYDGFHTTRHLRVRFSFSITMCPQIKGLAGLNNVEHLSITTGRQPHLYLEQFWLSLSPCDDRCDTLFPKLTEITLTRDLFEDERRMATQMMLHRKNSLFCAPLVIHIAHA